MGCNSDYMQASQYEEKISKVACLIDEINGKNYDKSWWYGYHPRVYNNGGNGGTGDQIVNELCELLQSRDVSQYSLEMQIWWRDHQAADKERCEREISQAKDAQERIAAIEKLSPHERKLLGL